MSEVQNSPKQAPDPETLLDAVVYFQDPDNCIRYLAAHRWNDGVPVCPTCGSKDVGFIASRRMFQCKTRHAKAQFSVKLGTILEDSPPRPGQVAACGLDDRKQPSRDFLLGTSPRDRRNPENRVVYAPSRASCDAGRLDWRHVGRRSGNRRALYRRKGSEHAQGAQGPCAERRAQHQGALTYQSDCDGAGQKPAAGVIGSPSALGSRRLSIGGTICVFLYISRLSDF